MQIVAESVMCNFLSRFSGRGLFAPTVPVYRFSSFPTDLESATDGSGSSSSRHCPTPGIVFPIQRYVKGSCFTLLNFRCGSVLE